MVALRYLSHWPRRILRWGLGPAGEDGASAGLRHEEGAMQESERGEKGWRESLKKRRGTSSTL